jgi:hypothetical protein
MIYQFSFEDQATSSSVDTWKTMAGIIAGAAAGHRGRLLSLDVGFADNTPPDLNIAVRVCKTNQDTAGTATDTIAAGSVQKADPNQRDSVMSIGRLYSVEPTTYDNYKPWQMGVNCRGGLMKTWTLDEALSWGPNQTLGILMAPRAAGVMQVTFSGTFEEW